MANLLTRDQSGLSLLVTHPYALGIGTQAGPRAPDLSRLLSACQQNGIAIVLYVCEHDDTWSVDWDERMPMLLSSSCGVETALSLHQRFSMVRVAKQHQFQMSTTIVTSLWEALTAYPGLFSGLRGILDVSANEYRHIGPIGNEDKNMTTEMLHYFDKIRRHLTHLVDEPGVLTEQLVDQIISCPTLEMSVEID